MILVIVITSIDCSGKYSIVVMVLLVLHHTISSIRVAPRIKESIKYCYNRCIFVYIHACLSFSARAAS